MKKYTPPNGLSQPTYLTGHELVLGGFTPHVERACHLVGLRRGTEGVLLFCADYLEEVPTYGWESFR